MDFTMKTYEKLLIALLSNKYAFLTVREFIADDSTATPSLVLLRHDVEARYANALQMAEIQASMGIKGTYYFRMFHSASNNEHIRKIAGLGHEIGYHYDDLSHCKGDADAALKRFVEHLEHLRQFGEVTSISMEGAPMSKYDNRDLWSKSVSYRDYGITTEPYFDLDFRQLFYLTDTARRWDGWNYSRRDKFPQQKEWSKAGFVFHSSFDIIRSLQQETFPKKLMMTFHPQRWTSRPLHWAEEFVGQNIKNIVKRLMI